MNLQMAGCSYDPSMTELLATVVNWNVNLSRKTNFKLAFAQNSYADMDVYCEAMKSFVTLEFHAQLRQAKANWEKSHTQPIKLSVESAAILGNVCTLKVSQKGGDMSTLSSNDVILVISNARRFFACVAQKFPADKLSKKESLLIWVCENAYQQMVSCLDTSVSFDAWILANLTDVRRQISAIANLNSSPLSPAILSRTSTQYEAEEYDVLATQQDLKINEAQARSVLRCIHTKGLSKIHGPPGTGKTKTIAAMVGAILSTSPSQSKEKILICAPSNLAVDNVTSRIRDGVMGLNGKRLEVGIVRVGRRSKIGKDLYDLTVEGMILKDLMKVEPPEFGSNTDSSESSDEDNAFKTEFFLQAAAEASVRITEVEPVPKSCLSSSSKELLLKGARAFIKRQALRERLYDGEFNFASSTEQMCDPTAHYEEAYSKYYKEKFNEILNDSQVICATLSSSALLFAVRDLQVKTVIIDEASQCAEPAALIPLQFGSTNCIQVGDAQQLPPTVIARVACDRGFNTSLFERLDGGKRDSESYSDFLDIQYRMHSEISKFPSEVFYKGRLKNSSMSPDYFKKNWHSLNKMFGPYSFFDVVGRETRVGTSYNNADEANAVLKLVKFLQTLSSPIPTVGIISPYIAQTKLIRKFLSTHDVLGNNIRVSSVDGFQGQEKDIIIFSCVRASGFGGKLGFLADERRVNVALTRAKYSLWIVGDSKTLAINKIWKTLVENSKLRERYFPASAIQNKTNSA